MLKHFSYKKVPVNIIKGLGFFEGMHVTHFLSSKSFKISQYKCLALRNDKVVVVLIKTYTIGINKMNFYC